MPASQVKAALAILLSAAVASCADRPIQTEHAIARVGFFHVGGETVTRSGAGIFGDVADDIRVRQISVLSLQPDGQTLKRPVVMLPGFGLAADSYLQTPDGRPGWAMDFARRGYPVYLVEPGQTTRSGIDSGFYRSRESEGRPRELFSWGARHVWSRWGLGPEYGVPFPDGRFPVEHYDQVVASFTAVETDRIAGEHNISYQLDSTVKGLESLLETLGPSIILAHSASGVAAFEVALKRPDLVTAVVNVEPVGCPDERSDGLKGVAVLSLFGDHMEVRPQMPVRQEECRRTVAHVGEQGTPAALLALPELGITGNSHLMMFENNSGDIASMIMDWLERHL